MRSPRSSEPLHRAAIAALAFLLVPFGAHTTLAQPKPAPIPAGPKPAATTTTAPKPAGAKPAKPGASASATATAAPAPVEGEDEAGRLYAEGFAAFERGAFPEAEAALTKAWALSKSFDVAGALGSTKLELGKHREAAQYLSFALRNALPSTRATVRDRIKRDLDSAKAKLATVKLTVSLLEAKVAVDGAVIDPLFLGPEIYVDPGKRNFEAVADGYAPASSSIETKAGELYVVTLKLERNATPKGGGPAPTTPAPQGTPLPAAILGGAGGVAVIAGAVLIGLAESNKSNAGDIGSKIPHDQNDKPVCPKTKTGTDPNERCEELRTAAANADTFGNAGIGVFIGAGTLIAGATVYMLFFHKDPQPAASDGQKPPAPQSRVFPFVGTNAGGLVWQGSF